MTCTHVQRKCEWNIPLTYLLDNRQNPWLGIIISISPNTQIDLLRERIRLIGSSQLEDARKSMRYRTQNRRMGFTQPLKSGLGFTQETEQGRTCLVGRGEHWTRYLDTSQGHKQPHPRQRKHGQDGKAETGKGGKKTSPLSPPICGGGGPLARTCGHRGIYSGLG